ncbi:MAG: hypothetical protein FWG87_04020 [Defluviitaleaceae bacterium]|nr:hypothetical protein [Defluviitaleaceae bacterium]
MQGFCRGRIYPSRGTHVRQFVEGAMSIKQAVRCCLSGFLRQHRTPTIAELGNLGTDKSVPYNCPATNVRSENV